MKIAVSRESDEGESRVAAIPDSVKKLVGAGNDVVVESGAGVSAGFPDSQYTEAGATIAPDAATAFQGADVIVRVRKPNEQEVQQIPEGAVLISHLEPLTDPETIQKLASRRVTAFAMESIPRISRAQSMDALSSQATVSGYKAVLIGASESGRFLPMLTTAAGTVPPAKVFVIGAGVAGLQAIATARRLGAQVSAFDTRPAVKEQVKSLGAKFIEIDLGVDDAETAGGYAKELSEEDKKRQAELMGKTVAISDIVITTAAVPGKPAPKLIPDSVVQQMSPGSVIVDLAAETGGNCELTEKGQIVEKHGVKIVGLLNLPASMPLHASQLYAKNVSNLLELLTNETNVKIDFADEVVRGTCVTHEGKTGPFEAPATPVAAEATN